MLAQDVDSGELAYKPVLAVTIREPTPRIKIRLGSDTITATLGHPFWVAGQGWRMTKQLEVGSRLHTLSGAAPVEAIEKLPVDPSYDGLAYNLVVADFDNYFVGEKAILVHDNTPRQSDRRAVARPDEVGGRGRVEGAGFQSSVFSFQQGGHGGRK